MKTLVEKDLVYEKGRPLRRYYLSDEGWEVATRITNVNKGLGQVNDTVIRSVTSFPEESDSTLSFDKSKQEHGDALMALHLSRKDSSGSKDRELIEDPGLSGAGYRLGGVLVDKFNTFSSSRGLKSLTGPSTTGHDFIELSSSPEPQVGQEVTDTLTTIESRCEILKPSSEPFLINKEFPIQPQGTSTLLRSTFNSDIQPISLEPGTFKVHLVIDSREVRAKNDRDYIQEELIKKGVNPLVRPLELGDFFWVAKCNDSSLLSGKGEEGDEIALDWIIERKRLDDLVGSIKDGRFHEQKFRLSKSGVKNVVYIIEEFTMSSESVLNYHEAIQTAIASTQVVDGYFVKKTQKLDDTIRYLARMTTLLKSLYEVCGA